jgi:hypothetical protein
MQGTAGNRDGGWHGADVQTEHFAKLMGLVAGRTRVFNDRKWGDADEGTLDTTSPTQLIEGIKE